VNTYCRVHLGVIYYNLNLLLCVFVLTFQSKDLFSSNYLVLIMNYNIGILLMTPLLINWCVYLLLYPLLWKEAWLYNNFYIWALSMILILMFHLLCFWIQQSRWTFMVYSNLWQKLGRGEIYEEHLSFLWIAYQVCVSLYCEFFSNMNKNYEARTLLRLGVSACLTCVGVWYQSTHVCFFFAWTHLIHN